MPSDSPPNKTEPAHYNSIGIKPIDAINAWGLGFSLGNAVKYIARAGKKEGETELDDLRKAHWYVTERITFLESQEDEAR